MTSAVRQPSAVTAAAGAGGRLLLSTHGVFFYHPDPEDYWRWTCAGLRRIVSDAGLEVERFEGMMGLLAVGLQITQDAINILRA